VSEEQVSNLWVCPKCGNQFETSIYLTQEVPLTPEVVDTFFPTLLVAWGKVAARCQTESYVLNVMDKEQLPALLVLEPAKDHSRGRYLVVVMNAMELDDVVAKYAAVLARSNQQIQNSSFSGMGWAANARMKSSRSSRSFEEEARAFANSASSGVELINMEP
jgi:hypothetical protein